VLTTSIVTARRERYRSRHESVVVHDPDAERAGSLEGRRRAIEDRQPEPATPDCFGAVPQHGQCVVIMVVERDHLRTHA